MISNGSTFVVKSDARNRRRCRRRFASPVAPAALRDEDEFSPIAVATIPPSAMIEKTIAGIAIRGALFGPTVERPDPAREQRDDKDEQDQDRAAVDGDLDDGQKLGVELQIHRRERDEIRQ